MEYFCTKLLPLYVSNSSLAFETVLFLDKNLEQLCYETPFLSKYFPSFMKVRLQVASINITVYRKIMIKVEYIEHINFYLPQLAFNIFTLYIRNIYNENINIYI